jgi:hypothetical protein
LLPGSKASAKSVIGSGAEKQNEVIGFHKVEQEDFLGRGSTKVNIRHIC